MQEEEERRRQEGQPDQAEGPESPASLPRRVPGTAGEPKPANGAPWTKLPATRRGRLSDEDAEFDTDPFLPRLTASGAVASPPASQPSAPPGHTAQANGSAPPASTAPPANVTQANGVAQQDDTVRPDHARRRDRALRRRDRRAAKRDRAAEAERAQAERESAAQAEREQAERAERERAAQAERERALQAERERALQAERERALQAERERAAQAEREQAERERAAQAERERAQAERQRAAQAEREQAERQRAERAAQAQRERAAQAEREQAERQRAERERTAAAAWTERERAAQAERLQNAQAERARAAGAAQDAGAAQAGHTAAEPTDQVQRAAPPDQAEPEQPVPPSGSAQPNHSTPSADRRAATGGRALADQPWRPVSVRRGPGRRTRMIALVVGAAAVLAIGPLMLAFSHSGPPKPTAAELTRDQAAAWVSQQVSGADVVSCDVAMCLALEAHGVSVSDLLVMSPTARDLLSSQVIVSTAAIRQLFGRSLGTVYAPTVLASFGSGNARIDVRVIAPDGAAKYLSALRTDWQQRKSAGGAIAGNSRITLTAAARRQMDAGEVDAQLLLMLAELATQHPVDVLAFGDLAPGASPGVPLRSAILAENGAADLRSMLASVRAERGPYAAAQVETARRNGQPVLVIEFAAPVPLGLINGLSP